MRIEKLAKKASNPLEQIPNLQWRRRPKLAGFCSLSWSSVSWDRSMRFVPDCLTFNTGDWSQSVPGKNKGSSQGHIYLGDNFRVSGSENLSWPWLVPGSYREFPRRIPGGSRENFEKNATESQTALNSRISLAWRPLQTLPVNEYFCTNFGQ